MSEHVPSLVFHTERQRTGTGQWTSDHGLVVAFEAGKAVPLARLDWRDSHGAEAVIGFDPGMAAFVGLRIAADGTTYEWRGRLVERTQGHPHRFRVEGGEGRQDLFLLVEDGGSPVARLGWADREGGGGSVVLRSVDLEETATAGEVTDRVREVRAGNEHKRAGEVALNLLDATAAKWLSWRDADWLEFTLDEPVRVRHYALESANDFADRDPRDWELQGSSDGDTWVVLDSRSGEFFPQRHLSRDFQVTGSAAEASYRHLRLEITGNCGGGETQLCRVRFFSGERSYEAFSGHRYAAGEAPVPYAGIAAGLGEGVPATVEDWRAFLAEYSADMLRVLERGELDGITEEQRAGSWLGYDAAPDERITALEERLGVPLPPSYRSFLAASDGWTTMSTFMYEILSTAEADWLHNCPDDLLDEEYLEEGGLVGPLLLVSGESDAQYWLLDAGDVSPDGEWAAYVWASWYPGLGERHRSFADLVVAERASFEELSGAEGRPVRPEGVAELLGRGRAAALRGRVADAMDAFRRAEEKGSGAAAYLRAVLSAFLDVHGTHHELRGLLHRPHVVAEVGVEQIEAEALPLYLYSASLDHHGSTAFAVRSLGGTSTGLRLPSTDEERDALLAERRAPEPPAFELALDRARDLAARGADDEAWAVIEEALASWYPVAPNRVAPVVLLTDPALRGVVTPSRAREVVFTPRGFRADE
ncbi:discoidin domain-containing protein [Nocardiopsis sp. CT-R113]|uniref:Discoidin domain-containing protein n=1 Tax=Nocardiopsis codii TaxID=3065942 RepID=A0ABU7KG05_9ACTN|nr:SMI1/KNR4 family protein [Nocardiopsis sp. CT-R113]MEE2041147.1 discoidin domain-containing protein [Nocardiopsis sp. CT-R113]